MGGFLAKSRLEQKEKEGQNNREEKILTKL